MSTVFDQMLERYGNLPKEKVWNAKYEVTQLIALAGLRRGGFFNKAAFYGGTCLRIIYGMHRFSEDMDFSLLAEDASFHLEDYFQAVIDEFKAAGRDVVITKKDKMTLGKVESAFLKENTEAYEIKFQTKKTVKIKIELDTDPPLQFNTEQKLLLQPYSFMTRCFTLPDLYAGKMHALVYRAWQRRIKGRDWYDFEWYVRNGIPLDFNHLQARIKEFSGQDVDKETFLKQLRERLATADINMVKLDVVDFITNQHDLDIWSNDYFLQLADMIKFV